MRAAMITAVRPAAPNRYGSTGIRAPEAKKQKLDMAAFHAGADCFVRVHAGCFRCDRVQVQRGQHRTGMLLGFWGLHPASPVDQRQLVGIHVKMRQCRLRFRVGLSRLQQLALRPHRDVLSGTHRQRPRQAARPAR